MKIFLLQIKKEALGGGLARLCHHYHMTKALNTYSDLSRDIENNRNRGYQRLKSFFFKKLKSSSKIPTRDYCNTM